jgi:hypothetical protein
MKEASGFSQQAGRDELLLATGDEGKKGLAVKLGAAACALILTAALLGGYFFLRGRQVRELQAGQQAAEAARKSAPSPKAQVFQDEVMLRGSKAVVGGSVRNISEETLEGLSVEIELKSRNGQTTGTSSVGLQPASLRPGEEGRFAFQITPSDWSGTRVTRLLSAKAGAEVPFKPEMGAKRPPERAPAPKVIVVPRPKPKGDDFLNTPDTPIRIP